MSPRLSLAVVLALLCGCSWLRPAAPPALPLLPPAALGLQWQLTQSVMVECWSKDCSQQAQPLLAAWSVQDGRMVMAGLTATGQTLMTLSYDGVNFSDYYSPLLSVKMPGRQILALVQLAYWPEPVIAAQLRGGPWRLAVDGKLRRLFYRGRPMIDIQITGDQPMTGAEAITGGDDRAAAGEQLVITDHLMQIRLTIHTLSRTLL